VGRPSLRDLRAQVASAATCLEPIAARTPAFGSSFFARHISYVMNPALSRAKLQEGAPSGGESKEHGPERQFAAGQQSSADSLGRRMGLFFEGGRADGAWFDRREALCLSPVA